MIVLLVIVLVIAATGCLSVVGTSKRQQPKRIQQEERATVKQIEYIEILLKKTGKMGYQVSGPTDKLNLYELSKQEASFLIDYLKGQLYFEDDEE